MIERLVAALILVAIAVCCLWAIEHWSDKPHPFVFDAGFMVLTPIPGEAPVAIPDPDALFTPCPMSPQNIPLAQKRTA